MQKIKHTAFMEQKTYIRYLNNNIKMVNLIVMIGPL